MTRCLVTGASGYIGSRLVAALVAAGHQVTAAARDAEALQRFDFPASVVRTAFDVADGAACREALTGSRAEVAYYLVHSIGEGDFVDRDLAAARTFAAAAGGVRRIVYLGGIVPAGTDLSDHLQSRADVGSALADGPAELVWLRAAVILGAGSTSFEVIRHVVDRARVVPLPPWSGQRISPIAVDDVLHYLVTAAEGGALPGGTYDISNGERLTYADLLKAYAASRDLVRVWLPVPPAPAWLTAGLTARVIPLPAELASDLVRSAPFAMSTDDQRIRDLVPDPPGGLTGVAEACRRTVQHDGFTGVCATDDPLQLTVTDPQWAGRQ